MSAWQSLRPHGHEFPGWLTVFKRPSLDTGANVWHKFGWCGVGFPLISKDEVPEHEPRRQHHLTSTSTSYRASYTLRFEFLSADLETDI